MVPGSLQFSMKPSGQDVSCVPEANLCLLYLALWPVKLAHRDSTSGFPCLLAASSVDGEKISRILKDKERERLEHFFPYLPPC